MKTYCNQTCRFFVVFFFFSYSESRTEAPSTTPSLRKSSASFFVFTETVQRNGHQSRRERVSNRCSYDHCAFRLRKCNYGWLSSPAHCTSSGKVSLLSHRVGRATGTEEACRDVSKQSPTARGIPHISNSAGSWMAPRKLKRRDINPTHVCREATDGGRSKSVQQKQAGGEEMVWSPSALAVFCVNFWFCPQTDCTEHSHNISTPLPLFLILCCWEQSAVEWPPHTSFTRRCCCFNPDGSTALKHTCSCSFEVKLR